MIPSAIRPAVEAALEHHFGRPAASLDTAPVGGGCISPAARVRTAAGDLAFLKWAEPGTAAGMFVEEARALEAIRGTWTVRVPAVIAVEEGKGTGRGTGKGGGWEERPRGRGEVVGEEGVGGERASGGSGGSGGSGDYAWILLEWLEPGPPSAATWEGLGVGLAALHRVRAERYGWTSDNFIGSLPQENGWMDDWAVFWRERRLEPQLRLAYDAGWFEAPDRHRFDALLDRLDELLAPAAADGPSLLHGDLWSGNVHPMANGKAALIDPASYYGHREVDLAMADLFGGFDANFHHAYREAWPLADGYDETRRAIYQLYYLIVHVNLFGGGYVARTLDTLI